jgi:uncharacterized membrane protein YeaQ/YmgE (transglycosylase-associated protein family)
MSLTAASLLLSMVFGTFGFGFILYAKNAGKLVPAVVGALLMVVPYFIASAVWMTVICLLLTALPFIFRDL